MKPTCDFVITYQCDGTSKEEKVLDFVFAKLFTEALSTLTHQPSIASSKNIQYTSVTHL